jgi:hypothetical protein
MKAVKKISSSLYSSVFGENLRFRRNTVSSSKGIEIRLVYPKYKISLSGVYSFVRWSVDPFFG